MEHRYVMEQVLGRKLASREIVHHRDGNPQNNSPDNLALCAGVRDHLERFHSSDLKPPPFHRNGRKPKGSAGYDHSYFDAEREAKGGE